MITLLSSTFLNTQNKVILTTHDWPPYTASDNGKGIVTEIVIAVFEKAGFEVEIIKLPWLRGERNVNEGEIFAIFPYISTDNRKKTYDFSDPLISSSQNFFYLSKLGNITYQSFSDLRNFAIGGVFGFAYIPLIEREGIELDLAPTDEAAIAKLYLGRVDLSAHEELVAWYIINKLYPGKIHQFKTIEKPILKVDYRLMVSRNYPNSKQILKIFNQSLKKFIKTNAYKSVLKKYKLY
ncbi:MAG: transporter substrate-binding domain-containing protein [Spirochaetes bacterium]|nr:transporter substrate-binding domain-containing protein [Spirochaetota bacterium]